MDDEYTVETFANRDAPLPVISLSAGADDASSDEGSISGTQRAQLSAHNASPGTSDAESTASTTTPHKRSQSLQDRLFAKCVSYDIQAAAVQVETLQTAAVDAAEEEEGPG